MSFVDDNSWAEPPEGVCVCVCVCVCLSVSAGACECAYVYANGAALKKNNEAAVELALPADHACRELLQDRDFAIEFFILSDLTVVDGAEVSAKAAKSEHVMCPRCRRYEPSNHEAGICGRCEDVMATLSSS